MNKFDTLTIQDRDLALLCGPLDCHLMSAEHTNSPYFNDVAADPLGPIWISPSEYRDVTRGTPFDAKRYTNALAYRCNAERETIVESKIQNEGYWRPDVFGCRQFSTNAIKSLS
jgi:hypothetical protein